MKKLLGLLVVIMLFAVATINAEVSYEEKDGKWFVTITYENSTVGGMNLIGSLTNDWEVPGVPMTLNEETGRWEITLEMKRKKESYKFYDPTLTGEAAYIEDPEAVETVANPFGSKNGILRMPKAGGAASTDEAAEKTYNVNFGLWSRTSFNTRIGSHLSYNTAEGDYVVEDGQLTKFYMGEFGTTKPTLKESDRVRVWMGEQNLQTSNTIKLHGNAFKHLVLDLEVNVQNNISTNWANYWNSGSKTDRYHTLEKLWRQSGSNILSLFYAPVAPNGTWGRWVGEKHADWEDSIWVDQIVVSFPFDDIEVKIGVTGNNAFASKDPMMLISSPTGDKENVAQNLQFFIHPKALKGLNINLGSTHTWREADDEADGQFATYATDRVVNNKRKWMTYLDGSYAISKVGTIGILHTMNSWAPNVLDAYSNAYITNSAYLDLSPVNGLAIKLQGAMQVESRYMDGYKLNDANDDFATFRTTREGYDFLQNSAALVSIGYVMPKFMSIKAQFSAGGTHFLGYLAHEDSLFSGWSDVEDPRTVGPLKGGLRGDLNFAITPLKNDLIKIKYDHLITARGIDSFAMNDIDAFKDEREVNWDDGQVGNDLYDSKKIVLGNKFAPGIESALKIGSMDFSIAVDAEFSLIYRQNQSFGLVDDAGDTWDDAVMPTSTEFYFEEANLNITLDKISNLLKKFSFNYKLEVDYYDSYFVDRTGSSSLIEKSDFNKYNAQTDFESFYNQVMMQFSFVKNVTVGAGFIIRVFSDIENRFDADATLDDQSYDYIVSGGTAFQFKYKIPVEEIMSPTFFANVGLAWDPFNDDGDPDDRWQDDQWDEGIGAQGSSETSIITLGIKWDF